MRRWLFLTLAIVAASLQIGDAQLAGLRVLLRPSTARPLAPFVHDTFTDTPALALGSHVGEVGATWTTTGGLLISDAARLRVATTTGALAIASGVPPSSSYDVSADYHAKTTVISEYLWTCGYVPETATLAAMTGYCVTYVVPDAAWQFFRINNGTYTFLDDYPASVSAETTYQVTLELRSATKKVFIDGIERITSTDTGLTNAGRVAIFADGLTSNTTGIHLDNLRAIEMPDSSTGGGGGSAGEPDLGGLRPQMPAAYGMGATMGCRVGPAGTPKIVHINSLADTNTITFRDTIDGVDHYNATLRGALQATGPRCVVFERSGYIDVTGPEINISSPYLTVAGQTAPSPGVTVRMVADGSPTSDDWTMIHINTHDVLFQHFRIAPGWNTGISDSICNSGIQMYGGNEYNVVMDHMTLRWAQDDPFNFGDGTALNGGITNATMWRSLVAEGFAFAPGSDVCTGGGFSGGHGIGGAGAKRIAVIQSLVAHNRERNPWWSSVWGLLLNNLTYDWSGQWGHVVSNAADVGYPNPNKITAVGNRFVVGPNSEGFNYVYYMNSFGNTCVTAGCSDAIHLSDNTVDQASHPGVTVTPWVTTYLNDPRVGSPPSDAPLPSGLTPLASTAVESFVTANAGACPTNRDTADARIVTEVTNRTGTIKSNTSSAGGWPTLAENTQAFTAVGNPFATAPGQLFRSNLEMQLEALARACEP